MTINYCTNPSCTVSNGSSHTSNYGSAGSARVSGLSGFSARTTGYRFVGSGAATHAWSEDLVRNTTYTFSTYVKPEYTGTATPNINWYVNGAYYSTSSAPAEPVVSGVVERLSFTAASPNVSGTINGLLNVTKSGTLVSAQTQYELGTVASMYGDGDSVGGTWLGATGLSSSSFTAAASTTNVFPVTAAIGLVPNQPSITRSSSSPTATGSSLSMVAFNATARVLGEGPPLDLPPPADEPVWTIYVRNSALGREAQCDDYDSLTCIVRFNDVGTWELRLDRRSAAADALTQQGAGIEVRRDDHVLLTGPVTRLKRDRSDRSNLLTVSGVDDNVWLERRLAHPQPASTAPPYSSAADDARTGVGSTVIWQYVNVNLGPGAIAPRRLPTMTMATDPLVGTSVSGRARYDVLLELIQKLAIAAGDMGFRVAQEGTGLVFSVYAPEDKTTSVVFSEGFANLSSFSYESQAPAYTYVYGGGEGEGIAREFVEGQDTTAVANWGRIEKLVDAREQDDGPEVSQQIATALAENSEKLSLEITPVDTTNLSYGVHYQLGDKVSAVIDGVLISDIVREVEVKLSYNAAASLTPVLGTPGRNTLLALFEAVRDLNSRTRNLERR